MRNIGTIETTAVIQNLSEKSKEKLFYCLYVLTDWAAAGVFGLLLGGRAGLLPYNGGLGVYWEAKWSQKTPVMHFHFAIQR